MILNDESSDTIEGKCVEHCPFFYYYYNDGTDDFCLRKCPDGWGEDKQFGVCIECDQEIADCDECSRESGQFITCKKCAQGYLPDENHEECLDDIDALLLSGVFDSHGVYRYCDDDCKDCRLVNDHPVCFNCNPSDIDGNTASILFLHEDGSCITRAQCEWDEVDFRYFQVEYLGFLDGDETMVYLALCVGEFDCPEGYGVNWNSHTCDAPEEEELTTPNCVAFHWHDQLADDSSKIYWCDECEFGFYFRDYAYDEVTDTLYPPYCYPNFWMAMEDNLRPYYVRSPSNLRRELLNTQHLLPNDGGDFIWKPVQFTSVITHRVGNHSEGELYRYFNFTNYCDDDDVYPTADQSVSDPHNEREFQCAFT